MTCARLLIFLNGYDLLSVYPFTRVDVDTPNHKTSVGPTSLHIQ